MNCSLAKACRNGGPLTYKNEVVLEYSRVKAVLNYTAILKLSGIAQISCTNVTCRRKQPAITSLLFSKKATVLGVANPY